MTTPRAVLFDLDGTLLVLDVDIDGVRAELHHLFAPAGYDNSFRPVLPRIDEAAAVVATDEQARRHWRRVGRAVLDRAEVAAADRAVARPTAVAAIEGLSATPLGIVTDNGRACVAPALSAAGIAIDRFDVIVTRDEVNQGKPDPSGLTRAAVNLLPHGGTAIWVGDSPRDVAAGRGASEALAAGEGIRLTTVAVLGGRSDAAALAAAKPDMVVETVAAIADLLIE